MVKEPRGGALAGYPADSPPEERRSGRQARARHHTREKIIAAAYRLMADLGIEAVTINQITDAADVGFGSFYNYFKSKREVAKVVFIEIAVKFGKELDELNADVSDQPVKLARNIKRAAIKARSEPVWGWFLLNADSALRDVRTVFGRRMEANLRIGAKEGRYRVPCVPTAVEVIFGAMFGVMRAILEGRASKDAEAELAQMVLRVLGLSDDEAAALAQESLPEALRADEEGG